ncbi:MAG: hypothetical protein IJ786_00285 [Bacteroidaceae bacterium]|nr:hypothetical protein [Bacteroidaceae bacterium]
MYIAVDFDGTIVEHRYPRIGKEIPFAIATLRRLQKEGHKIVLWSVREGALLQEAVDWCKEHGLEVYAANKEYPEEDPATARHYTRKLKAEVFIDDRNLGGLPTVGGRPDWGAIYEMITKRISAEQFYQQDEDDDHSTKKKKGWWPF